MPSKERVGLAQLKVGILGIVALFFVTLLIFLLTGGTSWFQHTVPLHVYVSDASGLTEGGPVRINGISAGKVTGVRLSGETDPNRVIKIDFEVDEDMLKQIPDDSIASISSDNLLGSTKFLQVNKGKDAQTLRPGATMKASNTQEFQQLVQQGFGVLDSAQAILQKISTVLDEVQNGKGSVGKLLVDDSLYNSLLATVNQVQQLATTLNTRTGTIGRLVNDPTLYNQVQATLARVDEITQGLQHGKGTAGMLLQDPSMYNKLNQSVDQLNTILADLNAGKGTAGQLLKSDKLANQVSTTLNKVNVTLDKVNSGEGTLGQLLVNPALYDQATGTTRELHDLLKDFRANPKKFLSIRLHIF
ncbi:MAG TPA: MlaD family protein [Bryobacteraceae bacterium]|jgi:phospholipid/cholesterol/gamma-HCH transport system substrate-binding protein|nr:MlaD family protein [Bryobacteraceae bacterium]